MTSAKAFDYIIVGAGAAGCVIARRLVEQAHCRVLLLEAGGPDDREVIHNTDLPSMTSLWGPDDANWGYTTVAQPHLNGRSIPIAQGKVLGGGTSINAMMYIRGNRRDFDHWNQLGNEGWSYQDVLPRFKKSEDFEGGASTYRGAGGPLKVIRYEQPSPVSVAFVQAAMELGYAGDDWDCNAGQQEDGAFLYQSTRTRDNRRCSTAVAFLQPVLKHPNLTVATRAQATRILFDGTRATGIEYVQGGVVQQARAEAEVVLACGAFASPKLLMLSGLGPADELMRHGIAPLVDLPGVGRNLQDHLLFGVGYQSLQELPFPQLLAEAGLFTHAHEALSAASPELQFFFGPVQYVDEPYRTAGPGFTFAPILVQPHSRGTVTLRSKDPRDLAVVDPRYLECEADVDVLVRGLGLARALANTRALAAFRGRELAPGDNVTRRDELITYVRNSASTVWHPAGTCKMGKDREAVVNPRLQVHGVEGLRVADASIMPRITCGNTNAATIMIAEKAAELLCASHRRTRELY
ncbi:GMC family oxidoreductase [Corallococcus sicarius]|uniref:Choline dehydrogenase n=1 Tax=Corallococcus sicarius TaxID=2316726 RepID=A0A3A8NAR4_9BACT|nr:GMC family oxidoreductase N-terminal domain-containing protein [Corallococcus sicarius]RKH41378.1 choline dehydrogenase [Corallococcus sicarius]